MAMQSSPVSKRQSSDDLDTPDGDVLTQCRVEFPHRRVDDTEAFDQDILAAVRFDELRTEVAAVAEDAFGDGDVFLGLVNEFVPRCFLVRVAFLPTAVRAAFPRPPVVAIGLAVEGAGAGDRDVLLLEGVDERRVVHALDALPAGEDDGQVVTRIA